MTNYPLSCHRMSHYLFPLPITDRVAMSTVAIVDCRRQPIHHLSSVYNEALKL